MKITHLIPARNPAPRLRMDFNKGKRLDPVAALLMFSGIFLSMVVVGVYGLNTYRISLLNSEIETFSPARKDINTSHLPTTELDAIQQSLTQINLPWSTLFQALENIHSNKVRLLSIEPDPSKRMVRLNAETTDVYEMLNYIRALSAQPSITQVILINQEMQEEEKNIPLRFTLDASWGTR